MVDWRVRPGRPGSVPDEDELLDEILSDPSFWSSDEAGREGGPVEIGTFDDLPPDGVGSLDGTLLRRLGAASRAMQSALNDALRLVGVTAPQWLVLQEVARTVKIEPSELARTLDMARPTVTEILGRLRGQGLVIRQESALDGRLRVYRSTKLGLDVVRRGLVHAGRVSGSATEGISDEDRDRLRDLLGGVTANLEAARRGSVE